MTSPRQRRDPVATRNAILDAAERLFIEHGMADTPTSQIARDAKVTKSLIHHHFGSKDALWNEVKRRRFHTYYSAQKQMLDTTEGTAELLRNSMIAYFRFLQADPMAVRLMVWRHVDVNDPCLEQEAELYEMGAARIAEAQRSGELRGDLEPMIILKTFLGLVLHWFQTKGLFCQMKPDLDLEVMEERYLEDVLRIFFEGILPQSKS